MELVKINLYDEVEMRKPHPCITRSHLFQVVKLGADLKLQCLGCGNIIMIDRINFNKKYKKHIASHSDIIFKK